MDAAPDAAGHIAGSLPGDDADRASEGASASLHALDRADCLALLSRQSLGRVVVTLPSGGPIIRPVHYHYEPTWGAVVFKSLPGSKLYALLHAGNALFEVDDYDERTGRGWSVIVRGALEEVTRPSDRARVDAAAHAHPLAHPQERWLRLGAYVVTGRTITP